MSPKMEMQMRIIHAVIERLFLVIDDARECTKNSAVRIFELMMPVNAPRIVLSTNAYISLNNDVCECTKNSAVHKCTNFN